MRRRTAQPRAAVDEVRHGGYDSRVRIGRNFVLGCLLAVVGGTLIAAEGVVRWAEWKTKQNERPLPPDQLQKYGVPPTTMRRQAAPDSRPAHSPGIRPGGPRGEILPTGSPNDAIVAGQLVR